MYEDKGEAEWTVKEAVAHGVQKMQRGAAKALLVALGACGAKDVPRSGAEQHAAVSQSPTGRACTPHGLGPN